MNKMKPKFLENYYHNLVTLNKQQDKSPEKINEVPRSFFDKSSNTALSYSNTKRLNSTNS